MRPIVFNVVEPYHFCHSYVVEYLDILARMLPVPMLRVSVLDGAHEGDELAGNDPVQIAILDAFVILVLFDIEGPKIVPPEPDRVLKPLKAMEQRAVVETLPFGGVAVVPKDRLV